jgi:hypothetical protein
MSMQPYNNLYHCMGHTYGTWLPGDPKGFRSRHHRMHCEGDYENPPPKGMFDKLHQRSIDLLKRDPVFLTPEQRRIALDAFIASLLKRNIDVRIGAIDRIHFHILSPFPDHNPRHWIGIAKKESSHALKVHGCDIEGGIWAVRCKCLPIGNARHESCVESYIADHAKRGASVIVPRGMGFQPARVGTQSESLDTRDAFRDNP